MTDALIGRPAGSKRTCWSRWPDWAGYAAAVWSFTYGLLGLAWAFGAPGFPFGGPGDATLFYDAKADAAGPMIAVLGLLGALIGLVMARGRRRGLLSAVLIGFGVITALILAVATPDYRPLMAVARTPIVLIGAPFGWPEQLTIATFFEKMFPWPVINQFVLILGGLLWAGATIAFQRRTRNACGNCGRAENIAEWTTPSRALVWGRWAACVAIAIPFFYAIIRWAWAVGIPLGFSSEELRSQEADSPGIWLAGAGLATLAAGGGILTLGLVQRWGEVYPRWIPFLRGKPVRMRSAIIPATIVALLLTSAGVMYIRAALAGAVGVNLMSGPLLMCSLWGAALGVTAVAYYYRRRGQCGYCQRR